MARTNEMGRHRRGRCGTVVSRLLRALVVTIVSLASAGCTGEPRVSSNGREQIIENLTVVSESKLLLATRGTAYMIDRGSYGANPVARGAHFAVDVGRRRLLAATEARGRSEISVYAIDREEPARMLEFAVPGQVKDVLPTGSYSPYQFAIIWACGGRDEVHPQWFINLVRIEQGYPRVEPVPALSGLALMNVPAAVLFAPAGKRTVLSSALITKAGLRALENVERLDRTEGGQSHLLLVREDRVVRAWPLSNPGAARPLAFSNDGGAALLALRGAHRILDVHKAAITDRLATKQGWRIVAADAGLRRFIAQDLDCERVFWVERVGGAKEALRTGGRRVVGVFAGKEAIITDSNKMWTITDQGVQSARELVFEANESKEKRSAEANGKKK